MNAVPRCASQLTPPFLRSAGAKAAPASSPQLHKPKTRIARCRATRDIPPPPRPRKGTSANKTETKRWVRPTYLGAAGATRRCPARHYHLGLEPHLRGRGCGDKRSGSASPVPPRPGVRRHEAARGEERERRGSTALVVGKPGKFPNPPILPPRAAPAAATLHQLSGATLAQSGTSRTQTGHPALTGRRPQQQRQGDAAEQPPALHGSRQGPLSAAAL